MLNIGTKVEIKNALGSYRGFRGTIESVSDAGYFTVSGYHVRVPARMLIVLDDADDCDNAEYRARVNGFASVRP